MAVIVKHTTRPELDKRAPELSKQGYSVYHFLTRAALIPLLASVLCAQYVGSRKCAECHPDKFESQSRSAHAHALAPAPPGSPGEWAFGAGSKAITYVSQVDSDYYVEHGMSFYASLKSMALAPGH